MVGDIISAKWHGIPIVFNNFSSNTNQLKITWSTEVEKTNLHLGRVEKSFGKRHEISW